MRVTEATVRRIEDDTSQRATYKTFLKLASVLKADPFYLAFGDQPFYWEDESRLPEDALKAIAYLSARTRALDRRVSNLEAQAAGAPKRRVRG
jgi:hypothetical protein